jgi:MFS family permease
VNRPVLVTGVLALTMSAVAIMQVISIPLLPSLPEIFGTSISSASWVATATLISGAAVNPIIGRMGDMYGKRTLLLGCLGIAVTGTVLGALADSLLVLIVSRGLAGIGSGVIPLTYGIIRDQLDPAHLGRGVAVITAAGAGVGAGLGPVAMGAVLDAFGWRAVFWVTAALLLLVLVLMAAVVRGPETRTPARFDLAGAVVLAASLVVLLLGITNGAGWGWTSAPVVGLLGASAALVAWWLRWERRQQEPMVDLALNGRGGVLLAHLGGVMVGAATFTQFITSFTLVTLPATTGHGLGRSLAVAGLVQVPGALVATAAVMTASRLSIGRGAAPLLRLSAALLVAGFALSALRHGSVLQVTVSVAVVSAGLGIGQCAAPLLLLEHVAVAQTAAANAVSALARVVGSVVASALVTSVMATGAVLVGGVERPGEWTFVASYAIGALPAIAVGVLSGRHGRRPSPQLALACNSS